MAEEIKDQPNLKVEGGPGGEGEVKDRGLFDFVRKEEEEKKPEEAEKEEVLVTGVEKLRIEDEHEAEEKKHGLLEKLHRSHSSSSSNSSSDEEEGVEGEGGIKQKIKKKKQSLKEKLRRGDGEKKDEETKEPAFVAAVADETPAAAAAGVVEKVDAFAEVAPPAEEEKKGFLDKIKEKLPGHAKKTAEEGGAAVPPAHVEAPAEHVKEQEVVEGTEGKEKKGFLGKIMEKLHHKTGGEESGGSH